MEKLKKTTDKVIISENQIKKNIDWLFDDLWPQMQGREVARSSCYNNVKTITEKFNKFQIDYDMLLSALTALDGLGLVISTGLMFAVYPNSAVPFDKYTMGFIILKKIIWSPEISNGNYSSTCKRVLKFINNHKTINSIHDLVLAANSLDPVLACAPK